MSDNRQAVGLSKAQTSEKVEAVEGQVAREMTSGVVERSERIRDSVADVAEVVTPGVQAGRQAQAAEQESTSLYAAAAAVETATDARVEEEAWYFADEAEAYVRELKNEASVVSAETEPNDARTADAEAMAEIGPVQAESEAVFEQLTAGEADSTFDFEAVSVEGPKEAFEPPADIHEQLDVLFEQFAAAEESEEAYEANDDEEANRVTELDLTQEELTAELDALFGEEGYVIVDSSVATETIEPTAVDDTVGSEASLYEAKGLGAEATEEVPIAQTIESYMQEAITSEPERFAELSEMEQPEVLFEEMTQIVEAVQELADEEEMLGVDTADKRELYGQRLEVVVEQLMRTLDPDFDPAYVPGIVEKLLMDQSGPEAATDGLVDDPMREKKNDPGYDIPADDAKPWWLVGMLVARKEFALAA